MSIINAIILGIVQGLTEFLPVSSSGHLVLLQQIFGITEGSLFFGTMLHAGTLVSVFVVLWKDIWAILKKIIQPLTGYIILGTIPAVGAALLFGEQIEKAFDTGQFLGFCFLITSALLVTAEYFSKRTQNFKTQQEMTWKDSIFVGIMQAVAIVPGISRSGATITGALTLKFNRDFAARFSFLLSIPAILGALVLHTKELISGGNGQALEGAESAGAAAVIAGTITAAIVGFFAIRFMLKIIREKSLYGFAIYTGILGVLVLIDQFVTKFVF